MTERITFTPEWLRPGEDEDQGKAPRFFLTLASILDRDQFDAELDGTWRACEVARYQLRDIAIEGVNALLGGDDAGEIVQLIHAEYAGEDMEAMETAKVKAAVDVLAESWPEYRAAREQEARRNRILPTLAFQRWCEGWENVTDPSGKPIAFAREKGVIPDSVLRRLSPLVIRSVGIEAYRVQYGQGDAGNSEPPSN